jgi:hypothetical protein
MSSPPKWACVLNILFLLTMISIFVAKGVMVPPFPTDVECVSKAHCLGLNSTCTNYACICETGDDPHIPNCDLERVILTRVFNTLMLVIAPMPLIVTIVAFILD